MRIYGIRMGAGTATRDTTVVAGATFSFPNGSAPPMPTRDPGRDEIIEALDGEGLPGTEVYASTPAAIAKIRRRIEDRLRKGTGYEILAIARVLGVSLA